MRAFLRIFYSVAIVILIASAIQAQSASNPPVQTEEQSQAMIDTLKRMQIKREENEHKKLLEKGQEIKESAEDLIEAFAKKSISRLPREVDKTLKDMEKNARQIRSESGGSKDQPLETRPESIDDALDRLKKSSDRLNENLNKTTRRIISIDVINDACEVIELVRLLRGYIN